MFCFSRAIARVAATAAEASPIRAIAATRERPPLATQPPSPTPHPHPFTLCFSPHHTFRGAPRTSLDFTHVASRHVCQCGVRVNTAAPRRRQPRPSTIEACQCWGVVSGDPCISCVRDSTGIGSKYAYGIDSGGGSRDDHVPICEYDERRHRKGTGVLSAVSPAAIMRTGFSSFSCETS